MADKNDDKDPFSDFIESNSTLIGSIIAILFILALGWTVITSIF